jgi:hypothetical protein
VKTQFPFDWRLRFFVKTLYRAGKKSDILQTSNLCPSDPNGISRWKKSIDKQEKLYYYEYRKNEHKFAKRRKLQVMINEEKQKGIGCGNCTDREKFRQRRGNEAGRFREYEYECGDDSYRLPQPGCRSGTGRCAQRKSG